MYLQAWRDEVNVSLLNNNIAVDDKYLELVIND
jgi:hypothetical protein